MVSVTVTSVKGSIKIVSLDHIQLQFNHFNIYDTIRLYKKLRSIPMSELVPHFRKPKKWNTHVFRSAEYPKSFLDYRVVKVLFNRLKPNDLKKRRTAQLTSSCCIFYIYSTNIRAEYFNMMHNLRFFNLRNAVYFIMLTFFIPVLFTF